ncbi:MAG: flagellar biosynthetic protein FliO [Pseudomonadota bacterium]|nr:flagellar biosynthetic protein FliO [Pseudomonadota bacterium]
MRFWRLCFLGMALLYAGPVFASEPVFSVMGSVIQSLFALAIVLGAIALTVWILRRVGIKGVADGTMKVVSVLSLGARERLVIVEVKGSCLLLGVTSQNITLIDRLGPVPENPAATVQNRFQHLMRQIKMRTGLPT